MRVGLVGAQGVGKSTLARSVSKETGLPLVLTSSAQVFEEMGLSPATVLPFRKRMEVQHRILDKAMQDWQRQYRFITDRTPIDMLAYTMIDITSDTRLDALSERLFLKYKEDCIAAANDAFTSLTLVQPGIVCLDNTKPRASLDKALVETMNALMKGLILDDGIEIYKSMLPETLLDLRDRTMAIEYSISASTQALKKEYAGQTLH